FRAAAPAPRNARALLSPLDPAPATVSNWTVSRPVALTATPPSPATVELSIVEVIAFPTLFIATDTPLASPAPPDAPIASPRARAPAAAVMFEVSLAFIATAPPWLATIAAPLGLVLFSIDVAMVLAT